MPERPLKWQWRNCWPLPGIHKLHAGSSSRPLWRCSCWSLINQSPGPCTSTTAAIGSSTGWILKTKYLGYNLTDLARALAEKRGNRLVAGTADFDRVAGRRYSAPREKPQRVRLFSASVPPG